jgi:mannose-1-phosphate guanylyltransferase
MTKNYFNRIQNRAAIILAGGDGTRLKSLTRQISGDERPKQFCALFGGETLLEKTRRRAELKIQPQNIFYSLTKSHERFYAPLLNEFEKSRSFVQPENKGTAPAILFNLLKLARINPEATVAFFPSDHYFSDDAAFMNQVERAFRAVENNPKMLVLLGIEPEKAETSYGWIEPVESLFGKVSNAVSKVKSFWEKPSAETAQNLLVKGCLWNSFVMVGKVGTFLAAIEKHAPDLYRAFAAASKVFGTRAENTILRSLYAWIAETNFSSDILQKCDEELFVLRVGDVVWSDLGEPQRVLGTLANIGIKTDWLRAAA